MDNYIIPNWPAPTNIRAFSTTRLSGFGKSPYDNFNISTYVGDDLKTVIKNRQKLRHDLHLPAEPFWEEQKHTTNVIHLNHENIISAKRVFDASFTTEKNLVCVVQTADCLPILLCDTDGTIVAAIHAGWKGLLNGIIENTVKAMQTENKNLLAWLGPAIGPKAFEVGKEVYEQFIAVLPEAKNAFIPSQNNPEKFFANIYLLAKQRLNNLNITHIFGGEYCTYTNKELFYSFRRDKGVTGRMASLIWIN